MPPSQWNSLLGYYRTRSRKRNRKIKGNQFDQIESNSLIRFVLRAPKCNQYSLDFFKKTMDHSNGVCLINNSAYNKNVDPKKLIQNKNPGQ